MRGVKVGRVMSVGLGSGLLFGALDALIHANPLAVRLYAPYRPMAKESVNMPAGLSIDLAQGCIMAVIMLILYQGLPGRTGWSKGLSFGVLVWFLRVVMPAASTWIMLEVPLQTIGYMVVSGLAEMLILGLLYGLTLAPRECT
ncbi:MAG: hypothetical protein AB1898_25000 [Acidobacteriota bacterium]